MYTPITLINNWGWENPRAHKLYFEAYSLEERIKWLRIEIMKLKEFLDFFTDSLNGRLSSFDQRIEDLIKRIKELEERLDIIDNRLDLLDSRIEDIVIRINKVSSDLDHADSDIEEIEHMLDSINSDITSIENRINSIKQKISSIEDTIHKIENDIVNIENVTNEINSVIEAIEEILSIIKKEDVDHGYYYFNFNEDGAEFINESEQVINGKESYFSYNIGHTFKAFFEIPSNIKYRTIISGTLYNSEYTNKHIKKLVDETIGLETSK